MFQMSQQIEENQVRSPKVIQCNTLSFQRRLITSAYAKHFAWHMIAFVRPGPASTGTSDVGSTCQGTRQVYNPEIFG